MADVQDLSDKAIESLAVSEPVKGVLRNIQAEISDAYRENFVEMVQALNKQASTLGRIQNTLAVLVQHLAPQLKEKIPISIDTENQPVPVALKVAGAKGDPPDLATALVVADPIGTGYHRSQKALADALGLPQVDVSIIVRKLKINDDPSCAVQVRAGKAKMVNYHHARAMTRFRELVANPPKDTPKDVMTTIKRVQARLIRHNPTT